MSDTAADLSTSVLIVGSGLAGLSAAVMLAWRGVPTLLVERRVSTSKHPRARSVNFRSMELLRVAGLQADLMAAQGRSFADFRIVIAESVTGRELRTLLQPGAGAFDSTVLTPAPISTAGQDRVELILSRHAEALGAQLRYGTELVSLEQDASGVHAVIRELSSGREQQVQASYVIGADGHRSRIRDWLGIGVHGQGSLSHNIGIVFEGDVEGLIGKRALALYYLQNPQFTGVFVNGDDPGRAMVSVEYDPARDSVESFDEARCRQAVCAALGTPQFEPRILEVLPWEMSSRVADAFAVGRVFLVGDAAHTMPPTGGLGGQTAIQDSCDLAWKLACVLQGHAGPALLATYAAERSPVAELTVRQQTANYVERMRPDRSALSQPSPQLDYMEVAMGYRYRSDAIALEQPDDGGSTESPFAPTGRPGTRAAHVPLLYRGARISLLDLIGREFVLICGAEAAAWARAGHALRFGSAVPLAVYRLGADLIDTDEQTETRLGIGRPGATLLRPDGYVAWRSQAATGTEPEALSDALARALCRSPSSLQRPATGSILGVAA